MQPLVAHESTPYLKSGQVPSGGVGAGAGAGTGSAVISMSAQLVHTWSASSQSHLQLNTYDPTFLGTLTSSMTDHVFLPPGTRKPCVNSVKPASNMVPKGQSGVGEPWIGYCEVLEMQTGIGLVRHCEPSGAT